MPRRCRVKGCEKRPIYGFPHALEDKAGKNCTNSTDNRGKNTSSNDVEAKCKEEYDGDYKPFSEYAYEEFILGYPIGEEGFQQQMEDPHAVDEPSQSSVRYGDTQDILVDKTLPSTLSLAQNMSSSTLSSVSSCTTGSSTSPMPSDVPMATKRSKQIGSAQTMIFCRMHKMPGMTDVVSRRCEWIGGCNKRPLYGFPGERATVCASHKAKGMVDRKSRYMESPLFLSLVCIYVITLESPCLPLFIFKHIDNVLLSIVTQCRVMLSGGREPCFASNMHHRECIMLCPLDAFFLIAQRERVLHCKGKGTPNFGRIAEH